MTEEEKRIVDKSNVMLKRLTLIYFFIISVPLPFMMLVMLDNYHLSDDYQQAVFDVERYLLLSVMLLSFGVMWFSFKKFKKKLAVIRQAPLDDAFKAYKKENIRFYITMGLCSYPFFFLYMSTSLLLYAGIFCFLEFVIMPLERPSAKRLVRNLRIKKPLADRIKGIPEPEAVIQD